MASFPLNSDESAFGVGGFRMTFYGQLKLLTSGTFCDLWPQGMTIPAIVNPIAGAALEILSQAGDTSTIRVIFLDANGLARYEDFVLNGVTPIPMTGVSATFILSMLRIVAGGTHGTTYVRTAAGTIRHCTLPLDYECSETLNIKVPAGYKARIINGLLGASSAVAQSAIDIAVVANVDKTTGAIIPGVFQTYFHMISGGGSVNFDNWGDFEHPVGGTYSEWFPPLSEIKVRVKRSSGAATADCVGMLKLEFTRIN